MLRARQLVVAAHPGPSLVVTIVALGLAVASGASPGDRALLVVAVVAGQLSIGWSNDWIDGRRGLDEGRSDKPLESGALRPDAVRAAALLSLVLCIVISLALSPLTLAVHLVAVSGGWAYNLWLKATPASVVAYLVSFGLLPSIITTAVVGRLAPLWAMGVAACFGAGVHFANVLPDLADDRHSGIRGLPQLLGVTRSTAATVGFLTFGVVLALGAGPKLPAAATITTAVVCGGLLAGIALAARTGALELAFKLSMLTGLVLVGLLVVNGAALV